MRSAHDVRRLVELRYRGGASSYTPEIALARRASRYSPAIRSTPCRAEARASLPC